MRLRTLLFVPANNSRMIDKASTSGADAVIFDLEDSVPLAEKETARRMVRDAVRAASQAGANVFVRVNALTTGLAAEDLRCAVEPGLEGIVLPKAESGDGIREAEELIAQNERAKSMPPGGIALIPLVETAAGILDARAIAMSSRRIVALGFGALDFARDMELNLSPEGIELIYARSYLAVVARAANVYAIDTPWIWIADVEGLIGESKRARQLGFNGKFVIHPNQIEPVNKIFSPSEAELAEAAKTVAEFERAQAKGSAAISLDGRMIDIANYRHAKNLLTRAR